MVSVQTDFVRVRVQETGAMVTAEFLLDGRWINPFWGPGFPNSDDDFLRGLQGDFFCLPFGAPQAPELPVPDWRGPWKPMQGMGAWQHGSSSHLKWQVDCVEKDHILLSLFPSDVNGICQITRKISVENDALQIEDCVYAETEMRIPIGIHPIFRLPAMGAAKLQMPEFRECRTYPGDVDQSSVFVPDTACVPSSVPCRNGELLDATELPLAADTEELLWLGTVSEGRICLENREEQYAVELCWDAEMLPNCLLWYSNRGRKAEPWNGKNLCLGVEPVASAFDLGPKICCVQNPLSKRGFSTTACLKAGENVFRHSIALRALEKR